LIQGKTKLQIQRTYPQLEA